MRNGGSQWRGAALIHCRGDSVSQHFLTDTASVSAIIAAGTAKVCTDHRSRTP